MAFFRRCGLILSSCAMLVATSVGANALPEGHQKASATVLSMLRRTSSTAPGEISQLVTNLNQVLKGLQDEVSASDAYNDKHTKKCEEVNDELVSSIKDKQRRFDAAQEDLGGATAAVNAIESTMNGLKGQIDGASKKLDGLQKELRDLRNKEKAEGSAAAASLQQVEAVLTNLTSISEDTARHLRRQGQSPQKLLERQVSILGELGKSLRQPSAPSFLQVGSAGAGQDEGTGSGSGSSSAATADALRADKQAVLKASTALRRGINEEEKRLLDLIELTREELTKLERDLEEEKPAYTDKFKIMNEIENVIEETGRSMEFDRKLLADFSEKCERVIAGPKTLQPLRNEVVGSLKSAVVLLESMDTTALLTKELEGVQASMKHEESTAIKMHNANDAKVVADPRAVEQDDVDSEIPAFVQVGARRAHVASTASSSEEGQGKFDEVKTMIEGLIADLKDQANNDVDQHQFCMDSMGANRRERLEQKSAIDVANAKIRTAKIAMDRLDDSVSAAVKETERLTALQTELSDDRKEATERFDKQVKDHVGAKQVTSEVVVILAQRCGLDVNKLSGKFLQLVAGSLRGQRTNSTSTGLAQQAAHEHYRFAQCEEAAKLVVRAEQEILALDVAIAKHLKDLQDLVDTLATDLTGMMTARNQEKTSKQSQRAERSNDLATAKSDKGTAEQQLKIIEDQKVQLEKDCSQAESREDRMERLQEEIDALKEALNVLEGEAIPV